MSKPPRLDLRKTHATNGNAPHEGNQDAAGCVSRQECENCCFHAWLWPFGVYTLLVFALLSCKAAVEAARKTGKPSWGVTGEFFFCPARREAGLRSRCLRTGLVYRQPQVKAQPVPLRGHISMAQMAVIIILILFILNLACTATILSSRTFQKATELLLHPMPALGFKRELQ